MLPSSRTAPGPATTGTMIPNKSASRTESLTLTTLGDRGKLCLLYPSMAQSPTTICRAPTFSELSGSSLQRTGTRASRSLTPSTAMMASSRPSPSSPTSVTRTTSTAGPMTMSAGASSQRSLPTGARKLANATRRKANSGLKVSTM